MSVELTLREGRWNLRALRGFLETWASRAPLRVLEMTPWEANASGAWMWTFGEGSTRGFSVRRARTLLSGGALVVRLGLLASRSDWILAYDLLRALLRDRGGRLMGADERVLRPEDLGEGGALDEGLSRLRQDASDLRRELQGRDGFAALPNPGFSLILTPALLPEETDPALFAQAVEAQLVDMATRYQRAEHVAAMDLPDGSSIAVWPQDESLMPLAHYIGVRLGDGADESVVLRGTDAITLLGDRVELVSEQRDLFYLPALDPSNAADLDLRERLSAQGTPLPMFLEQFRKSQGHAS